MGGSQKGEKKIEGGKGNSLVLKWGKVRLNYYYRQKEKRGPSRGEQPQIEVAI